MDATPRWLGAVPAVLIATVLVAGVLLVAGYGIPVGIGVLAGLAIGTVTGLLVSAIAWSRRQRSEIEALSSTAAWTTEREHGFVQPPDFARGIELSERVDESDLVRVVAGGQRTAAAGTEVTLIAAELRAAGGLIHLVVDGAATGPIPAAFVQAVVVDDVGTPYDAAGMSGGGSAGRMRYEVRFAPAPPRDASALTVTVQAFATPFGGTAPQVGPWELRLAL